MDVLGTASRHTRVRGLPHIKRLDECFGDFLMRVSCPCRASRHVKPAALMRIAGRSATLAAPAQRMRCAQCGKGAEESAVSYGLSLELAERLARLPIMTISGL